MEEWVERCGEVEWKGVEKKDAYRDFFSTSPSHTTSSPPVLPTQYLLPSTSPSTLPAPFHSYLPPSHTTSSPSPPLPPTLLTPHLLPSLPPSYTTSSPPLLPPSLPHYQLPSTPLSLPPTLPAPHLLPPPLPTRPAPHLPPPTHSLTSAIQATTHRPQHWTAASVITPAIRGGPGPL
ncbi:hypothetical protein Pmani_030634 [Petrolisthes manimaculis]|uniref:Uncharacterized protein n=1 Tax=Petrolisthes manimaculis TaxID=1843537 RepID=A0AAE1NX68_9EUCA|nr:hypothetical protein Pmani_030634 [Petrolisthes manimaculis]